MRRVPGRVVVLLLLLAVAGAACAQTADPLPIPTIVRRSLPGLKTVMAEQPQAALPDVLSGDGPKATPSTLVHAKPGSKYDVSRIGNRDVGHGLDWYSLDKERALGREMSAEVEQSVELIRDPVITEYVNRVGQTLVQNSDAKVPFTIKVIDDDEINAFALPGGYFYVNSGLILAADNEAELAGVMAHEIAHVAARHATKNATRQEIWNLASIPLIFVGGPAGYAIRQIGGMLVPMSFLKFGRDAEREADFLGLEYQYAAGYDPAAFVQFFERMQLGEKKKHSRLAKAFSTHPMNEDRIARAEKEIATVLPPRDEYVVTTSEFDAVKRRLGRLTNRHELEPGKGPAPTLRKRDGTEADDGGHPTLKRSDPKQ